MKPIETRRLIEALAPAEIVGEMPRFLGGVSQDSRRIRQDFLFAARLGGKTAGFAFVDEAVRNGARLLMTAEEIPANLPIPAIRVQSFHSALRQASRIIYREPSQHLRLIGVTGTKGKTSSVHFVRSIIEQSGRKCAMLSTVGYWTGSRMVDATLTTPDADLISELLAEAVDTGAEYAVMEVSSHALEQGRTWGMKFSAAGFTGLSIDHLDFHKDLFSYSTAKERLFRSLPVNSPSVINVNESWGARMMRAAWGPTITVGRFETGADMQVETLDHNIHGGKYRLHCTGESFDVATPLVGLYQGENLALAATIALALGFSRDEIVQGANALRAVPGRMEAIERGQPFKLLVDFAHSPDSLQRAIRSLRPLTDGSIIVAFGCGGDRDRTKRPIMGRIAAEEADMVIVTSDNSRSEDPDQIIAEIVEGVPNEFRNRVSRVTDRREATRQAVAKASPGDIVLLAGKGSEWYCEIGGRKMPYDDRIVAAEVLEEHGYKIGGDR
jgi:UDP-N-acetylmuramoyl-L-alanyl-D-glutamate--2,6-diaminopimelate ligase